MLECICDGTHDRYISVTHHDKDAMFSPEMKMCFPPTSRTAIKINNTSRVPEHIDEDIQFKIINSESLLYEELHMFTLVDLIDMEMDICHIFFDWGAQPDLSNFCLRNGSLKHIEKVCKTLQIPIIKNKFPKANWFKFGMTLEDMINSKPSISMLLSLNVTTDVLLEKNAHESGLAWNQVFNWSRDDWLKLGFSEEKLRDHLKKQACTGSQIESYMKWGPRTS